MLPLITKQEIPFAVQFFTIKNNPKSNTTNGLLLKRSKTKHKPTGLGIDRSRYANIGMPEFTEERSIPKPSVFCLLFLAMQKSKNFKPEAQFYALTNTSRSQTRQVGFP